MGTDQSMRSDADKSHSNAIFIDEVALNGIAHVHRAHTVRNEIVDNIDEVLVRFFGRLSSIAEAVVVERIRTDRSLTVMHDELVDDRMPLVQEEQHKHDPRHVSLMQSPRVVMLQGPRGLMVALVVTLAYSERRGAMGLLLIPQNL